MYEELVKRLRNCISDTEDCTGCPYQGGYKGSYCMNGLISEAADAIDELDTLLDGVSADNDALCEIVERLKPRWVPVTERLPEDLTRVIVFCEDGVSYGLCEHLIADDEEVVEWHDFLHYPITPTHWMPLPDPPKEEA